MDEVQTIDILEVAPPPNAPIAQVVSNEHGFPDDTIFAECRRV
jgi:hypothetical protein